MRVKARRSANSTATSRSMPWPGLIRTWPSAGPADAGSSGTTARSWVGRTWQASRIAGVAPIRASTRASPAAGGGRCSTPCVTRMRQVEQRPRPPHTAACGMPPARLASSRLVPGLIATVVPSG